MARATKLISLLLLQLANSLSALDFKTVAFEGQFSDLFYVQGESEVPIDVNGFRISKMYTYNGSSPLIFYVHTENEAGEKVRTPVAQLPYDPRNTSLLLLFAPVPSGGYQVYPIANDNASHPPGAYRVQNLTRLAIGDLYKAENIDFATGKLPFVLTGAMIPERGYNQASIGAASSRHVD